MGHWGRGGEKRIDCEQSRRQRGTQRSSLGGVVSKRVCTMGGAATAIFKICAKRQRECDDGGYPVKDILNKTNTTESCECKCDRNRYGRWCRTPTQTLLLTQTAEVIASPTVSAALIAPRSPPFSPAYSRSLSPQWSHDTPTNTFTPTRRTQSPTSTRSLPGVGAVCCESIANRKTLYPTHPGLNDLQTQQV